jgi:hypothetical protein
MSQTTLRSNGGLREGFRLPAGQRYQPKLLARAHCFESYEKRPLGW